MGRRSGMLVVMGMVGLLAACGGGGGGSTSAATGGGSTGGGGTVTPTPVPTVAAGWWTGSTDDHRTLTGLVFGDGSFSILYSAQDAPDSVAGLVQGTGAGVDGAFNSTAAVDTINFSLADGTVVATQLSATVVAAQRFDGKLSVDAPAFSMTYNPACERTASLDDVAGSYDAQAARPDDSLSVALTIDAQGVLSGSGTGCRVAGTLTPRSDANAFDIVLALSGDDCASNGSAFGGIAFFDADTRRLSVMAPNAARTDALVVRAARTD